VINTHHTNDNLDLQDNEVHNEVHNPSHRANWSSYLKRIKNTISMVKFSSMIKSTNLSH